MHTANPGKNLIRTVDGVDYQRIPLKTHLITKDDKMEDVINKYAKEFMQPGDILFISEKAVACTQNRAIPMEDIKPRKLAVTLSKYVTKTPAGIGLGIPETMEMALQECGTLRILFAAFCSVIGKLLVRRVGSTWSPAPRLAASTAPPRAPFLPTIIMWCSPPPTPWVPPRSWPRHWVIL